METERKGDEVNPESNAEERENGGKDRRRGGVAEEPPRRRRDRNDGRGSFQFNFLRNSLVFEIQPPKGCARG